MIKGIELEGPALKVSYIIKDTYQLCGSFKGL